MRDRKICREREKERDLVVCECVLFDFSGVCMLLIYRTRVYHLFQNVLVVQILDFSLFMTGTGTESGNTGL